MGFAAESCFANWLFHRPSHLPTFPLCHPIPLESRENLWASNHEGTYAVEVEVLVVPIHISHKIARDAHMEHALQAPRQRKQPSPYYVATMEHVHGTPDVPIHTSVTNIARAAHMEHAWDPRYDWRKRDPSYTYGAHVDVYLTSLTGRTIANGILSPPSTLSESKGKSRPAVCICCRTRMHGSSEQLQPLASVHVFGRAL